MNATSRAILQSVVTTDAALSALERGALQRVLEGLFESAETTTRASDAPLLLTQKDAAKLLSVSRVTVWRLTRDQVLHPVEILPGTWRYAYDEIAKLARVGADRLIAAVAKRPVDAAA